MKYMLTAENLENTVMPAARLENNQIVQKNLN